MEPIDLWHDPTWRRLDRIETEALRRRVRADLEGGVEGEGLALIGLVLAFVLARLFG